MGAFALYVQIKIGRTFTLPGVEHKPKKIQEAQSGTRK
jgi:hypothetical protein